MFFFFNDTATTEIYTLSLHDALPILTAAPPGRSCTTRRTSMPQATSRRSRWRSLQAQTRGSRDRKSTRLNSSHGYISYAVFCLKKKNKPRRDARALSTEGLSVIEAVA